tara:strand:+ start:2113 stop:3273 length:1161 start_codon:yes stop_codon:yes gene_type:complete
VIYYYVESKRIDEVMYLCKSLKLHVLTNKKDIHGNAVNEGLVSTLISNQPRRFKKEIRNIAPSAVILDNDSTSARGQWIARNYKSYLISELQINTRARYFARSKAGFIGNKFFKVMHRLAGITGLLYGVEINMHDFSTKTYLRLLRDRFCFNYKPHTSLPGWYCNKIIVQNDEIKRLYNENNFSHDKVINIGSPHEDYLSELCKNTNNITTDIDVLLFSQPFYLRGFDDWIDEVGDLVDDCYNNGLKLVIKLHPGDDIRKYSLFKDRCAFDTSDGSSQGIVNLLRRSRLIVIKHSTVMIQSLLCRKPIAFINYRNVLPFLDGEIDFLDSMILTRKGDVKSIFDASSVEIESVMEFQEMKLSKIARFDTKSISRLSTLLYDDELVLG